MSAVTIELRRRSAPGHEPPAGLVGRVQGAISAIPSPPFAEIFAPLDALRAKLIRLVAPYCAAELWGSERPARAQAHIMSPEQSNPVSGLAPPHW